MQSLINFFKAQYEGILVGVIVSLGVFLIIFLGKRIFLFFNNIPKHIYKKNMEKKVSESFSSATNETGLPLFPKIKLKIVSSEIPAEEMEDKIIIFVKKGNKPVVFSNIIAQTLDKTFLIDSKIHMDFLVYNSTKYVIGKSLVTHDRAPNLLDNFRREALRYFDRKMENLLSREDTLDLIRKEELIAISGLFKSILLQELFALGERQIGKTPSSICKEESKELVEFLYDFSRRDEYEKERGKMPALDFFKTYFKLAIILVRKPEQVDITRHFRAVRRCIEQGVLSIYILGLGRHTKQIKGDFVDWLKQVAVKDYNNEWSIENLIETRIPRRQRKEEEVLGICCIFRHKLWLP